MEEARLLVWSQMISEFWSESGNKSKLTLSRRLLMGGAEGKSEEIPDIVEFTRQRLGFDPNPLQESVLRGGAARHRELHAAVGEIDRDGGKSRASRAFGRRTWPITTTSRTSVR